MKWSNLDLLCLVGVMMFSLASPAQAGIELVETHWRAVAVDGSPVTVESNNREPHLVFSADGRVSGSAGCNRLTGSYEKDGNSLRFGQTATTKMACPPPLMTLEQAFLQALGATAAMQISGNTLALKDAAGKVRMSLEGR